MKLHFPSVHSELHQIFPIPYCAVWAWGHMVQTATQSESRQVTPHENLSLHLCNNFYLKSKRIIQILQLSCAGPPLAIDLHCR